MILVGGVIAMLGGMATLAAVDPVPWARAQMAFTSVSYTHLTLPTILRV